MSQLREVEHHRNVEMNEITDKVQTIAEKYEPDKIILLGSYAAGNPTSDIGISSRKPCLRESICRHFSLS